MADSSINRYVQVIRKHLLADYQGMYREAGGAFEHPFLTPGSAQYADVLWDWDSWLSNVALRQILLEAGAPDQRQRATAYERGCVLNSLSWTDWDGYIPIVVSRNDKPRQNRPSADVMFKMNMHKPCLAQHAAFLVQQHGDATWLREKFYYLQAFVNNYVHHHRHAATGLYYWQTDVSIGVDNDPCTYFRPPGSSGSIYLNCLMLRELAAMDFLCRALGLDEIAPRFRDRATDLAGAIQRHCWDERDGFFYSVDLNLLPPVHGGWVHTGGPRDWDCLIQRIGVWSGFLALWAGVATPEQAQCVVEQHFRDDRTFRAPFGVRTLSKAEKMYNVGASGNPSSWLGPIWGNANYLTFRGLVRYGFNDDARELAEKTIRLFGQDLESHGVLHEYYLPESGRGVLNPGFQNWNYLVLNMIAWLEGRPVVEEF
jgi:putative isomerase